LNNGLFCLRLRQMRKYSNNSLFQYVLIVGLAFALMIGQPSKLHMHIEHSDVSSFSISDHRLNVHIATSLHDSPRDAHHKTDYKVSSDSTVSTVKKVETFTPFILFFLFVGLFLTFPLLRSIFRKHIQTKLTSTHYLLNPPLRAPPIHFPA